MMVIQHFKEYICIFIILFVCYLTYLYIKHIMYREVLKVDKKNDLRIIKTKKVLFNSLLSLMKEKNFEKIKISDICDEALINRSTFYAHYEDKYDLLIALFEDQRLSLLEELEGENNESHFKEYIMKLLGIVIDYIDDKKDVYSAILLHNRNGLLIDFLIDVIERDASERLKGYKDIKESNLPLDIIVKFYVGGIINIGISWLTRSENYTKDELLKFIDRLIPEKI